MAKMTATDSIRNKKYLTAFACYVLRHGQNYQEIHKDVEKAIGKGAPSNRTIRRYMDDDNWQEILDNVLVANNLTENDELAQQDTSELMEQLDRVMNDVKNFDNALGFLSLSLISEFKRLLLANQKARYANDYKNLKSMESLLNSFARIYEVHNNRMEKERDNEEIITDKVAELIRDFFNALSPLMERSKLLVDYLMYHQGMVKYEGIEGLFSVDRGEHFKGSETGKHFIEFFRNVEAEYRRKRPPYYGQINT